MRFDARQIAVRIRSETLGLRAGISRRPTGFGKLPMIELISCGSHDPSASLSCFGDYNRRLNRRIAMGGCVI